MVSYLEKTSGTFVKVADASLTRLYQVTNLFNILLTTSNEDRTLAGAKVEYGEV